MEHLKKMSSLLLVGVLFWPAVVEARNAFPFFGEAKPIALSLDAPAQTLTVEKIRTIQEGIVEIVHQNGLTLFEQMDRMSEVQGNLGRMIRDHAAFKFQTAQDIESLRFNLDELITEMAAFQVMVSEKNGKWQEEIGQAIVRAQRSRPNTNAFRMTQERLGRLIRDNALFHDQIASELGERQGRLGLAILDHATSLIHASEKIGEGEEHLGQMFLQHAQTLRAASKAIAEGQQRLALAIREGARREMSLLAQFE